MVLLGPIVAEFATAAGLLAGMIAVCGFIAHAGPTLSGASEKEIRQATVIGGMAGLAIGSFVVVLSALLGRVIA
jgi:hypothetical protein